MIILIHDHHDAENETDAENYPDEDPESDDRMLMIKLKITLMLRIYRMSAESGNTMCKVCWVCSE